MNGGSPEIMKGIFRIHGDNVRHQNTFRRPIVNSVHNGTETVSFLGHKIWELIPTEIKELISLNSIKKVINKWKPVTCPCKRCGTYIHRVDFVSILTL